MPVTQDQLTHILDFCRSRYSLGDAGKTLLQVFSGGRLQLALAVGIGSDEARAHFLKVARFALRQHQADMAAVVFPALQGDAEVLIVECQTAQAHSAYAYSIEPTGSGVITLGKPEALTLSGEQSVGDLFDQTETLPGIMRRDLSELIERFSVPLDGFEY